MVRLHIALVLAIAALAAPGAKTTFLSAPGVALAQGPDLQDGDLLVGVHDGRGAIVRIRAGVAARYCITQQNPGEPMFFDTPKDVVIDSRGDVVFLAYMSTSAAPASLGPYGLWRCSAMGAPPELIGAFGTNPAFDHPRPLGDRPVKWAGGLHLKRASGFDVNTGTASTTEWYVFVVADGADAHRDTIAFNPELGTWADAGFMDDPLQPMPAAGYFQFDMINGGFGGQNYTVSAAGHAMKVVAEPISVEFEIAGFGIAKLAFQSVRELVGAAVDDLTVGNADGHQCLTGLPGTPRNAFGTINGMAGIYQLAWPDRLLMESDSVGMGHPFIPFDNMALFNIDPFDDAGSLYVWPQDCSVLPKLLFTPWHPFNSYNDSKGLPRSADVLAPGATAGTQRLDGRVIGIGPSQDVVVLASGLNAAPYVNPTGIDVYPGYQPSVAGLSLFVRIDSPVTVLITDGAGRRLGVDPATGSAINDFGQAGFDSETTEPHIYGIRQPVDGEYRIETFGTGTGPYHVTVFGVNHSTLEVSQTRFSGNATPGAAETLVLAMDPSGRVTSTQEVSDTTPPTITATRTAPNANGWNNGDVVVAFECSDTESAITVAPVTPVVVSSEGFGQSATATCEDAAGNRASMSVDNINIDRTPPQMGGQRAPQANDFGWNNTDVSVSFSCADALSGVEAASVSGTIVVSTDGANQSVTGSCQDLAGNEASIVVGGINIDRTPPVVSCSTNPSILWPPNHKLVPIEARVEVVDSGAGAEGYVLSALSSNEPSTDSDGDAHGWTPGTDDTAGWLRAARAGSGNGRVYTLAYTGFDQAGNTSSCLATVVVPHDRRR